MNQQDRLMDKVTKKWHHCKEKILNAVTYLSFSQFNLRRSDDNGRVWRLSLLGLFAFFFINPVFSQVSPQAQQLIVAIAPSWDSHRAELQCWTRENAKSPWQPAFQKSWPVLLGRKGLAWGRGAFSPTNSQIPLKVEKDWKAPAGIFELGALHGYASKAPERATWPYLQVGPWDAWVDNPNLPHYNEHVRVDPNNVPPWFESQRMRLGDNAYKWLLEIRHNTNPAVPGQGSAIFFHVRRGPDRPSAGCTTMELSNLEKMIRWLRPEANPYYVLLPQSEYNKVKSSWGLP